VWNLWLNARNIKTHTLTLNHDVTDDINDEWWSTLLTCSALCDCTGKYRVITDATDNYHVSVLDYRHAAHTPSHNINK